MPPPLRGLDWDDWNEQHIGRHGVSRDEVEEACFGNLWVLRSTGEGKRPAFGRTDAGRYLFIVLADRGEGIYYPVSARDMTLTERRRYRQSHERS